MTELEMFIDGIKYKIKRNTKKLAPIVLAGTIGATTLGTMVSCGNNSDDSKSLEPTSIEKVTDAVEDNSIVEEDAYAKAYETIDEIEDNTVDFINDGLANGFYDYGNIDELTEEQKMDIVKMTLYSNMLINRNEIGGVPLAIINGERTLTDTKMREQFTKFMQIFGDQLTITTPNNKMDYSKLIMNEEYAEIFTKLANYKAKLHNANKNNDTEKYNKYINKIVNVKEDLIDLNSETNGSYIKYPLDLTTTFMALSSIYDLDRLDGNIITDKEDRTGIYNKPFNVLLADCSDELEVYDELKLKEMAKEFKIEGYENMTSEQILATIKDGNTFTGSLLNETDALSYTVYYTLEDFNSMLSNTMILDADEYYYEDALMDRVYDRVDWSLYNRIDAVDYINAFNYGEDNKEWLQYWENQIGKTTYYTTDEKNVPVDQREESTKEYNTEKKQDQNLKNYDETKKAEDSGNDYITGKGAGEKAGSQAAYNQQIKTGKIPSTISSAPSPGKGYSADYISGYQEGYIDGWNNYVSTAKASHKEATTYYETVEEGTTKKIKEEVENVTEKSTEQSTEQVTEKSTEKSTEIVYENGTYFEEYQGEEELIEEGEIEEVVYNDKKINFLTASIKQLTSIRNFLVDESSIAVKSMSKRG